MDEKAEGSQYKTIFSLAGMQDMQKQTFPQLLLPLKFRYGRPMQILAITT